MWGPLYQTESLELLLPRNYHHLNATFLDPSALLLLSCVRVTAGFSNLTKPASPQMFAQIVEWHHTLLNICSSALPARHNWQLKTCGTIQTRWLIFSSSTTTDERRGAVGYNNSNRTIINICLIWCFLRPRVSLPNGIWLQSTALEEGMSTT